MNSLINICLLKPLATLVVVLLVAPWAHAQLVQRTEVGVGVGTFVYTGDLSRGYNFLSSRPAATLIYRVNFSGAISLKASITAGSIGASDANTTNDALAKQRAASFENFLIDGVAAIEYHFLNWHDKQRRTRLTPYATAGVGLFGISEPPNKTADYSNVQFNIPLGVGVKYKLTPNLYLALEVCYRQTFFDYLDNVSGGDQAKKNYKYGDKHDYDGYFFTGISINYTFYKIPCAGAPYR